MPTHQQVEGVFIPADNIQVTGTRQERRRARKILQDGTLNSNSVKKIKFVSVKVDSAQIKPAILFRCKRIIKKQKSIHDLSKLSLPYKFPYSRLKYRQRLERVHNVTKRVIVICVDKKELKEKGFGYLDGNVELCNEVLNIVNGIKEKLEKQLNANLGMVEYPNLCDLESDEEEDMSNRNKVDTKLGSTILLETSGREYNRIREKLQLDEIITLPSTYKLNQELPLKV